MITTMPTGLLARVQKLTESNQQLTGKVADLEKRLAAVETALTAPLPDESAPLEGIPNSWPTERKLAIVAELDAAKDKDEIYKKYGVTVGHYRYWKRLSNGQG